jgi:hypothetical protein
MGDHGHADHILNCNPTQASSILQPVYVSSAPSSQRVPQQSNVITGFHAVPMQHQYLPNQSTHMMHSMHSMHMIPNQQMTMPNQQMAMSNQQMAMPNATQHSPLMSSQYISTQHAIQQQVSYVISVKTFVNIDLSIYFTLLNYSIFSLV